MIAVSPRSGEISEEREEGIEVDRVETSVIGSAIGQSKELASDRSVKIRRRIEFECLDKDLTSSNAKVPFHSMWRKTKRRKW